MRKKTVLTGVVLDEHVELSLDEFRQACSSSTRQIVELVEEGILEPVTEDDDDWRFSGTTLVRARTAVSLRRDLDINLPGVALALELMDEIEALREKLCRLEGRETE